MRKLIRYTKVKLLLIGCFSFFLTYGQDTTRLAQLEGLIANCVDRAMRSSVYIIEYDTVRQAVKEGIDEAAGFSGVVVSGEGHILTVSHAAVPKEVYQIRFPDGKCHIAVGLGRMGMQADGTDYDMAMLKIVTSGEWPYAKMGRTSDLKMNQPLVSVSYPGSFYKSYPNVRFGRLTDLETKDGFLRSTTKMEPGDSGGALFDEHGRVVGIHSWIDPSEDINYDVPVDFYLKYWTAMQAVKDYHELPISDVIPASLPMASSTVPEMRDLLSEFPERPHAVVEISSNFGQEPVGVLGTVLINSEQTFIVSKSSMVGSQPLLKKGNSRIKLQIVKRYPESDLVIMQADQKLSEGILLTVYNTILDSSSLQLGGLLISDLSQETAKGGVLSAKQVELPLEAGVGYFGLGAAYDGKIISITAVDDRYQHTQALKKDDHIIKINEVKLKDASDYNRESSRYLAGDSVTVDVLRDGTLMHVGFYLPGQPTFRHVSFDYPGGRSERSDGFKNVSVQDAAIRPEECGGPVFDTKGRFLGINIARRSRTATLILPVSTLMEYLGGEKLTF